MQCINEFSSLKTLQSRRIILTSFIPIVRIPRGGHYHPLCIFISSSNRLKRKTNWRLYLHTCNYIKSMTVPITLYECLNSLICSILCNNRADCLGMCVSCRPSNWLYSILVCIRAMCLMALFKTVCLCVCIHARECA